jgi:hypothetical protein
MGAYSMKFTYLTYQLPFIPIWKLAALFWNANIFYSGYKD